MTLADKVLQALEARAPVKGPDRNGNFMTLCPFHDETNPSFSYHPERGYKCFACNAKGSVRMLAEHLGIESGPLTLEQLAEVKGLPLDWLKKVARQGKKGVEIPYVDDKGQELGTRIRLNLCKLKRDERFIWAKDSKVIPYGLFGIEAQKARGYTILVEGESDSWTLWHSDFCAVGIPGARTWKLAWARYFRDFQKLYVALEPDEAGRSFLADIVTDLPDVLVILLPGGIKDLSDLYLSDPPGFANNVMQLMDEARNGADLLADLAKNYDMNWAGRCGTWKWDAEGLHTFNKKGEAYTVLGLKVNPAKILITPEKRRLVNLLVHTGGHVCETHLSDTWVGMRPTDATKELALAGVALTGRQASILQEFIGDILNEGNLPTKLAYDKLGWYENHLFVPGMNNASYLPTPGLDWLRAYGTVRAEEDAMTQEAWQYVLEVATNDAPSVMAGIGAALAAPFLELVPRVEFISFIVHFHTTGTGSGKTTVLELAAATIGDPRRICTSWDATKVGLEQTLGPLRHLPLFLNELGDAKRGVPEDAVMMLAEEIGRRRGAAGGGLRQTAEWRTIILSTGNAPIAQGSAHHARRVLAVPTALPGEDFARECQEIAHTFFGHPFRWCIKLYETQNLVERIRELGNCYAQFYMDDLLPIKPQAELWALVEIGARMLLAAVGLPEDWAHKAVLQVAEASTIRRRAEGVDYVTRLLQLVQEDMARDPGAYGISGYKALRGTAGKILEEVEDEEGGHPTQVAILPSRLQELIRNSTIPDLTGVLIEAKDRGLLETSRSNERGLQKRVRIGGMNAWCYAFAFPSETDQQGASVPTRPSSQQLGCNHEIVFGVPTG